MYYFSGNNIDTIHKHHGHYDPDCDHATLRVNDKLTITHSLSVGGIFNLISGALRMGSAGQTMGASPYGKVDDYPENWFYYDHDAAIWVTDNGNLIDTCRRVLNCSNFDPEFAKDSEYQLIMFKHQFHLSLQKLLRFMYRNPETRNHQLRFNCPTSSDSQAYATLWNYQNFMDTSTIYDY